MTKKRSLYILILMLAIAAVMYAYWLYNKPHRDVASTKAMISLTADELFKKFEEDEAKATAEFADQVLEVSGSVLSLDLSNSAEPQLVLETADISGFIRCGFKPDQLEAVNALEAGDQVVIKGECKGMNATAELDLLADKDVVLSKCIIIE